MADQAGDSPKVMHATLREVEAGVFSAEYAGNATVLAGADTDVDVAPGAAGHRTDTHLGTDPQAVKFWVEEMALSQGYAQVIWDELPAQLLP